MNRRAFIRSAIGGVAGVLGLGAVVKADYHIGVDPAKPYGDCDAEYWYKAAREPRVIYFEPQFWSLLPTGPGHGMEWRMNAAMADHDGLSGGRVWHIWTCDGHRVRMRSPKRVCMSHTNRRRIADAVAERLGRNRPVDGWAICVSKGFCDDLMVESDYTRPRDSLYQWRDMMPVLNFNPYPTGSAIERKL